MDNQFESEYKVALGAKTLDLLCHDKRIAPAHSELHIDSKHLFFSKTILWPGESTSGHGKKTIQLTNLVTGSKYCTTCGHGRNYKNSMSILIS